MTVETAQHRRANEPFDARNDLAQPWHALEASRVLEILDVAATTGLSGAQIRERRLRHGPNRLPEPPPRGLLRLVLEQLRSPLVYLLGIAALIALVLGHRGDAAVIAVVVALNTAIGALQQGRAERALRALRSLVVPRARVIRDGHETVISAEDVVPGDVLVVEAGDGIVADARLLEAAALRVAEAALTGESVPVEKCVEPVDPAAAIGDRRCMLHAGTHVTAGRARAVVVATGASSEIGKLAALAEGTERPPTPLERRVGRFGRAVAIAAVVMFVIVNAIGAVRGLPPAEVLMVALGQLVSMVPEGLPVALTIALAVGVQRMARRNAIIRRLAAVETLGSTTVICTDKTGTLTRNELRSVALWLPGTGRLDVVHEVAGADRARLRSTTGTVPPSAVAGLEALLESAVLCNDATVEGETRVGDPTETALLILAKELDTDVAAVRAAAPRIAEIPFDPAARYMATEHRTPSGARCHVKGAPEVILELCDRWFDGERDRPLDEPMRHKVGRAAEAMGERALRVLAFGRADGCALHDGAEGLRGRLTLLGLVGQIDPPRPEVPDAVARARQAGIRPVMVTGDHRVTARAIARQVGIDADEQGVVEGRELASMDEATLDRRIEGARVFSRVAPEHKLRIVEALQRRGHVVAMTGDGVNDAPALVRADVGVAMGRTGTEVARQAADVVLADDDFATIVAAVEEGRVVRRNVEKVVLYLLSTSIAEVVVLTAAMLLGYGPPLAAVQILWINLVTEGTVTVNLVLDPGEGDEMRRPPVDPRAPLVGRHLLGRLALLTSSIAAVTLLWFIGRIESGVPAAQARTEAFTVLAVCQWFNVLNCRSAVRSALDPRLLANRWLVGGLLLGNVLQALVVYFRPLGEAFHTVPIGPAQFVLIGLVASSVLWVEELRKLVVRISTRATPVADGGLAGA
ncbi:MAG: HAD-IC family P-type ATPase [Myxococcota bacterium]|nr:HAD-IC family P-type ATPase [Myxococcota bacterium]MDW8363603.1 HAD-IC family P-type ATPase [Myxococcales bacterium]